MAQKKVPKHIIRYDGGINQQDKPYLIASNEGQEMQNYDLDRSGKGMALPTRLGNAKYFTTPVTSATSTRGIYQYITKTNTSTYYLASLTNLYKYTTAGTTRMTFTLTADKDVVFATFNNKMLFVNGANAMKMVNSEATGTVAGSPPIGARYIQVYANRVWAIATASSPSRITHCAVQNEQDWTTAKNAGYVDINPDDGDTLTGGRAQRTRLVLFKNRATYALTGRTVDKFAWDLLNTTGCVAPLSIAVVDDNIFYLSDDGVYLLPADATQPVLMSRKVRPIIDSISDKTICCAGLRKNQYRLAYNITSGGKNIRELVLNFRTGAWTEDRHPTVGINSYFYDKKNDRLFAGSASQGMIIQIGSGNTDKGAKIYTYYKTGALDAGEPDKYKHWEKAYLAAATSSSTIYMDYFTDFVSNADQRAISLGSSTVKLIVKREPLELGTEGRYLEIALSNSADAVGASVAQEVYTTNIYGDVVEDD